MRRSLRKIRPAISRNAWYCFVNKLVRAGEWDRPLLVPTECPLFVPTECPLLVPTECPLLVPTEFPFDGLPTLEADEPRRASNDLVFADELFFTNKFQNCEGVSKLGTETIPRELLNEYFKLIYIKKYSIFFFFLKIRNYG